MGTADCEARRELIDKLKQQPFVDIVRILLETDIGDGYYLLYVYSPLLPKGYNYSQDIIIDGDKLKFRTATDT